MLPSRGSSLPVRCCPRRRAAALRSDLRTASRGRCAQLAIVRAERRDFHVLGQGWQCSQSESQRCACICGLHIFLRIGMSDNVIGPAGKQRLLKVHYLRRNFSEHLIISVLFDNPRQSRASLSIRDGLLAPAGAGGGSISFCCVGSFAAAAAACTRKVSLAVAEEAPSVTVTRTV